MLTDPYDHVIWNDTPGNNPITLDYGATDAWCDPGQPFLNSIVDISAYAGQTVQFRWRLGSDSAAGNEGWYLDDIKVSACSPSLPEVAVDPTAVSSSQQADTVVTQTVTISNSGGGLLDWQLYESMATSLDGSGGGAWSDNFDSYGVAVQLHGVGGWTGWGNSVASGALTSDTQARSNPYSVDINGASDLVHTYTQSSGVWTYTAWQYIPGDFSGTSYFIMLNQYDNSLSNNNWSVQVQFQSATGVMQDDVSLNTLPFVTDAWAKIEVVIDLDADTQTFYYNGSPLYTGVWNGYQSGAGTGSDVIAAVDLYANNASPVYYDDLSLIAPVPECENPTDLSWLSASPTSGAVFSGSGENISLAFDSTGLSTGTYTGTLCVETNDPIVPVTPVALSLTVEEPEPDIFITSPEDGTVFTATNGISVTASVEVTITEGFVIPTDGHWHLWLDGTDTGPVNSYAGTVDLLVGMHVISAQLQTPDHMPLGPVDTIMVTVVTETVEPPPTDTYIYLPFVVNGSGAQAQATPTSHVAAANNDDWSVASLAMFPILVGLVIPFRRKSGYLEG
jgi:hypothetical protein